MSAETVAATSGSRGDRNSARALFATKLATLCAAAGNPTLERIAAAAAARMRAANPRGSRRGVSLQRISDWRAGRNVPARFEPLVPVLLTLIESAEAGPTPLPRDLADLEMWRHLWKAARTEVDSARLQALPTRTGRHGTVGAAAAAPRPTVTTALRRDTHTFVGRDAELRRILDAATPGRVVSIHTVDGMPGVGKTALVTRAAHLLSDRFPDGRFFVELNAYTPGQAAADPFDVLARLLTDLGIGPGHIPNSLDGRRDLWRDRVADKRVLLVLDDARDLAQIEPLLPAGPECLTLITSRRRLVALDGALPLPLDMLEPDNAAALFCRLAQRTPTGSEAAAVAEIVRLCGYLPLAIVLLAGRLAHHPAWTIADLAAQFATAQDRLGELDVGQRAVRASFGMSYDALPPERQQLFRRLGLHPGTAFDAYAVAALNDIPVDAARRDLEALYTEHLIDETAPGRYGFHDLVREYARTVAHEDPPDDRARAVDRLLGYYETTAGIAVRPHRAAQSSSDSPSGPAPDLSTYASALAWMRIERANLLACLEYAASNDQLSHAVALTNALADELRLHGPWQNAVEFHQRAAVAADTINDRTAGEFPLRDLGSAGYLTDDYSTAAELLQRVITRHGEIDDPADRISALRTLSRVRYLAGDFAVAADVLEQVRAICDEIGDRAAEGFTLKGLSWVRHLMGDYAAAIDLAQRALTIFTEVGNRYGAAGALQNLGWVRCLIGDYSAAADALRQAAILYHETGRPSDEAYALMGEAWVYHSSGDYPTGYELMERALAICRDSGNRSSEAFVLNNMGWVRMLTGGYDAAAEVMELSAEIYHDIGNSAGEASALNNLGRVRYLTGEYTQAADLIRHALAIYEETGNRLGEAEALSNLGWVYCLTGDHPAADDLLWRALAISREIGHRYGEVEALNRLGALSAESGDPQQALEIYGDALRLARRIDDLLQQARALDGSARCRARLGDRMTAKIELKEALAIYQRLGTSETESAAAYLSTLVVPGCNSSGPEKSS
ncbi:tetratricopeptide repeat protein [Nocardia transvalensis]|uniref:tetratricopeptide repeat protein n=1 Tax=Nocardia transvalensis TaxID=37333 RepID=UPI0018962C4B|nr:tetratricopeptide repeat protein [Nocardia transvalensis]MBF6331944.1 tetratricopeptide repeat protein [Nocardia transvalensis]